VPGTDFVGVIPQQIQYISVFSAALTASSHMSDQAKLLISFLASAKAADAIRGSGMEPMGSR
jgi:molybdate transport system substrate-binding protein